MAFAQSDTPVNAADVQTDLNWVWVMVAAMLVVWMQAGFAFLEIGFARGKNVGTIVAKILVNFSICAVVWWAVGFAFAFGGGPAHSFWGDSGFFLTQGNTINSTSLVPGEVNGGTYTFFFFQFAFAAVSLAIVWGSTLERIKFIVYPIYAVVFSAIIYPFVAHALFAGNLTPFGYGVQDFAGSSVVHLCGAVGALAAVLVLGPRRGKFGPDGKPRAIPGHNMPLFGLAVLILWLGWFGFNPGSTLNAVGSSFAQVAVVTNLAAGAGVLGATLTVLLVLKTLDVGMIGNGAIAGLVAITAPSGYVSPLGGVIIGFVAGVIVVFSVVLIEKKIDDPVGVLSAHGVAGIWGTLACGLFTTKDLALDNQKAGLFYGGGLTQLAVQAVAVLAVIAFVFIVSYIVFKLVDVTIGMRVSAEEEEAGLDISEHGMYGYPEQFIPEAELTGYNLSPVLTSASAVAASSSPQEA
ncbi:MAG: ammonium transporter [Patulibacter sp.]|nr:ammonium transporter [Patulibacter sp.]